MGEVPSVLVEHYVALRSESQTNEIEKCNETKPRYKRQHNEVTT